MVDFDAFIHMHTHISTHTPHISHHQYLLRDRKQLTPLNTTASMAAVNTNKKLALTHAGRSITRITPYTWRQARDQHDVP